MNFKRNRRRSLISQFVADAPDGLSDLIADIAREVLREQPTEDTIYGFIADYLDALLKARHRITLSNGFRDELLHTMSSLKIILEKRVMAEDKIQQSIEIIKNMFEQFFHTDQSVLLETPCFREDRLLEKLVDECELNEQELLIYRGIIRKMFDKLLKKHTDVMKASFMVPESYSVPGRKTDLWNTGEIHLSELNLAATKIQAVFRGYVSRRKSMISVSPRSTHEYRTYNEHKNIAKVLQDNIASSVVSFKITESPSLHSKKQKAAVTIQSNYRGHSFRRRLEELHRAATTIQASYRGHRARLAFNLGSPDTKLQETSQIIQRVGNCYQHSTLNKNYVLTTRMAHKEVQLKGIETPDTDSQATGMEEAARKIQTSWKKHKAREDARKISRGSKPIKTKEKEKENDAAVKIQSAYKGHRVRREIQERNKAVTKIQAAFRGHLTRKELKKQNDAAVKIQSVFKGHLARKDMPHN